MRTILSIVAVCTLGGCAGTGGARQQGKLGPSRNIPVVSERPSPLERQRVNRQREAERATLGLTDVRGNITR